MIIVVNAEASTLTNWLEQDSEFGPPWDQPRHRRPNEIEVNCLFCWLREFGPQFGWRQTGKLDQAAGEETQARDRRNCRLAQRGWPLGPHRDGGAGNRRQLARREAAADKGMKEWLVFATEYAIVGGLRLLLNATARHTVYELEVPLAAGVLYPFIGLLLSPMIAALAMSPSSASVIANALRLR